MMNWRQDPHYVHTATYGSFVSTGPSYVGLHERVSNEMAEKIFAAADDCARKHLDDLGKQRGFRIKIDIQSNQLSIIYAAPFTKKVLMPLTEFCGPLSLIAAKPDGDREAFICTQVEKLISMGEQIIDQKFRLK